MHFADFRKLKSGGRNFDCSKCLEATKKIRRCTEERWDFTSKDGKDFPISLIKGTEGHSFCPSKLHRDDPAFVLYCHQLYVAYKTGNLPKGRSTDMMDAQTLTDLQFFIKHWESLAESEKFNRLGMMLGGGDEGK